MLPNQRGIEVYKREANKSLHQIADASGEFKRSVREEIGSNLNINE